MGKSIASPDNEKEEFRTNLRKGMKPNLP